MTSHNSFLRQHHYFLSFLRIRKKLEGNKNVDIQNQIGSHILKNLKGSGADAIKKFTPSLGIPHLGV